MSYLKRLDFGNEAGEDATPSETSSYFVEQESFESFADIEKTFLIARAKKGVGKSALLEWLYVKNSTVEDVFVVKARGSDLSRFNLPNLADSRKPNDKIYNWMSRISAVINRDIGRRISFAFDDDDISLVQTAEIDGFKERNFISALIDRFRKPIEKLG